MSRGDGADHRRTPAHGGHGPRLRRGPALRTELHAAKTAATATITNAELVLGRSAKSSAFKGIPIGDEEAFRAAWDEEWSIPQKRAIIAALIDTLIVKPARTRQDRGEVPARARGTHLQSLTLQPAHERRCLNEGRRCSRVLMGSVFGAGEDAELGQCDRITPPTGHPGALTRLACPRHHVESRRQTAPGLALPIMQ